MSRFLISLASMTLLLSAPAFAAVDVGVGQQLYKDNCAVCHGDKGEGQAKAPAHGAQAVKLTGDAAYWEFAAFKRAVMQGLDDKGVQLKAPMPLFATEGFTKPKGAIPTDEQLESIQAYLKTLGPAE